MCTLHSAPPPKTTGVLPREAGFHGLKSSAFKGGGETGVSVTGYKDKVAENVRENKI